MNVFHALCDFTTDLQVTKIYGRLAYCLIICLVSYLTSIRHFVLERRNDLTHQLLVTDDQNHQFKLNPRKSETTEAK